MEAYLVVDAGEVDVLTFWAEDVDGALPRQVRGAHRQAGLSLAESPAH